MCVCVCVFFPFVCPFFSDNHTYEEKKKSQTITVRVLESCLSASLHITDRKKLEEASVHCAQTPGSPLNVFIKCILSFYNELHSRPLRFFFPIDLNRNGVKVRRDDPSFIMNNNMHSDFFDKLSELIFSISIYNDTKL